MRQWKHHFRYGLVLTPLVEDKYSCQEFVGFTSNTSNTYYFSKAFPDVKDAIKFDHVSTTDEFDDRYMTQTPEHKGTERIESKSYWVFT